MTSFTRFNDAILDMPDRPLTPEQRRRAALYACEQSNSVTEAAMLIDMLGLRP